MLIAARIERIFQLKKEKGFTLKDLDALDAQDPVLTTPGSAWPYTPEYLDLKEE